MKKYPLVCIIILNWNGKNLLKDCLFSLFKLTNYPNYKVIIVDNGSTDGSVEFIKKNFPQADVLALDKNYGFPKGNNKGIKYAFKKYNPKYILLLNNDIKIIQKYWLTKMIKVAERDKKIGIVGCKLLFPNGKIQHAGIDLLRRYKIRGTGEEKEKYKLVIEVDAVNGACFLVKSQVFKKIGCLDEIFSPGSAEDIDLCMRAKKEGFKIYYCGTSTLIHYTSQTISKIREFDKIAWKNKYIFLFRYKLFITLFKEIIKDFLKCFVTKKTYKISSFNDLYFHKNFFLRLFSFFSSVISALKSFKHRKIDFLNT